MTILRGLATAVRVLCRRPSFSVAAVVTLALGIGANVAVFSAVRAVLVDELPYPRASDLVALLPADHFRGFQATAADVAEVATLPAFASMAGCARAEAVALSSRPTVLSAPLEVTRDFFDVWGGSARTGRVLADEDFSSGVRNAVISFDMWRSLLASDPEPIGKSVILRRQSWTVVGVMPSGFWPPCFDTGAAAQAWIPHAPRSNGETDRDGLAIVGRLKPGVDMEVAQAQVDALTARLAADRGDSRLLYAYLKTVGAEAASSLAPGLLLLQSVALLLLLITCANLGNLFLVHTTTRYDEFVTRVGLGARPVNLIQQVLTEAAVVAAAGAALGLVMAAATMSWLRSLAAPVLPRWVEIGIAPTDLIVGLGAGVVAALVFGSVPAILTARLGAPRLSRGGVAQVTSSRAMGWWRGGLVAAQVLLAVVLLVGAGLLIRSFIRVTSVPVGFDARRLVTTDVHLDAKASDEEHAARVSSVMRRLEDDVRHAMSNAQVSFANSSPFVYGGGVRWEVKLPMAAQFERRSFAAKRVSPNYLEVAGIPLLRGRSLAGNDQNGPALPAVVSAAFVRGVARDREVLGGELRSGDRSYLIVGVVGDVKSVRLSQPPLAEVYVPIEADMVGSALSVVVRAGDERRARRVLGEVASRVNPDGPAVAAESLTAIIGRSEDRRRFYSVVVSLFAFLSAAVAIVGVYGALAQAVGGRSREIGIRTALGARPRAVVVLVMRQGLRPVLVGLLGGVGVAWLGARAFETRALFQSLMFEISARDPWTIGAVVAGVFLLSLLAAWAPAQRAARTDPAVVLREFR